jgi:phenylpropionate dioxygenase-like ring-hydroxylating dioxygenase large terminal subunit
MKHARAIAPLAVRTQSGYSLGRPFYCDDAVFTADMEQVVGRNWIVAGHARD